MVLLLACVITAAASSTARAQTTGYAPSSAPYSLPANNAPLEAILKNPTFLPGEPTPHVSGLTYPAAWDDAAKVTTRARVAGRFLPGAGLLGQIGLGVSALTIGWQVGSPFGDMVYERLTADLGGTAGAGGSLRWDYGVADGAFTATDYAPDPPASATSWRLKTPSCALFYTPSAGSSGFGCGSTIDTAAFAAATTTGATVHTYDYDGTCCGLPSFRAQKAITLSAAAMEARITRTPITAAQFAAEGTRKTTAYVPSPSIGSADDAAARGVLGAPVARRDTDGTFRDAAGTVLAPAQVNAQNDLNCRLDASYCAGGANSPGDLLTPKATMPDCSALTYAACLAALEAAGFTVAPTRVILDFDGAVVTKPADAVVTTSTPAGANVAVDTAVTITTNPNAASMPVVLPAPNSGETGSAYRARLAGLGLLGTVTLSTLGDDAYDPSLGPDLVVRTNPRIGTRVHQGTDVVVVANPSTAPDTAPGWGPFVAPVIPAISLAPLSHAIGCNSFPFGIPCWTYAVVSSWVMEPVAPVFCMPFPFVHPDPCIDMGIWDDAMPLLRSMLLLMSFIGLGWMFMRAALGFGGGGSDDD